MTRPIVAALLAVVLPCAAAHAGAKQDRERQESAEEVGVGVDVGVMFAPHERELVRAYYIEHHGKGHCPPGLAKKNNGCLPPGQAKKRYVVGRPLEPGIVIAPVPQALEMRIGPAPSGYVYGMVDGDVVKLAVGTLLVVDAVNSLVR
jgi:hypothetical protein